MFQPQSPHLLSSRAEEHDACVLARLREFGALAEEPISRMNRFGVRFARGLQNRFLIKVAFRRGRRAKQDSGIGSCDVPGVAIGVGVDGYRRYAERSQSANDPARDDASIRDQYLLEHRVAQSAGSQISTRIGDGLYALQGLF